jgi:hypothetical protein
LLDYCHIHAITHSFVATARIHEFIAQSANRSTSLAYVLTGGEQMAWADTQAIDYQLVNNYGPTETR